MTRVVVLSDTHLRSGGRRRLPDGAYRVLADAEVILHAGDIVTADLLHELSGFAPTHAVPQTTTSTRLWPTCPRPAWRSSVA